MAAVESLIFYHPYFNYVCGKQQDTYGSKSDPDYLDENQVFNKDGKVAYMS